MNNLIKLIRVKANSFIESVGYSNDEQKLIVKFIGGKIYQYFGAPMCEFICLLESHAPGCDFRKWVKPNYEFELVDADLFRQGNYEYADLY